MKSMEYKYKDIHNVINSTLEELENLSSLIIPLTYSDEADENRLQIKKSLFDVKFYLKALELKTRPVTTDEEYYTDKYKNECDKYGM